MAKKKAKKPARRPRPRSETHVRANFVLSKEVLAELQTFIFQKKLAARLEGTGPPPTMSQLVEDAVWAELAKRKKKRGG